MTIQTHNNVYGLHDAKNKLSELVDRAQGGETVIITRHGQQVAKIVPLSEEEKIQYPQAFLDFLKRASENPDRYMKDLEIVDRSDILPYERDIF